jgi:hypothetical protein
MYSQDYLTGIVITVSSARRLDEQIIQSYKPWLQSAPASYTKDHFFTDSFPITITSRCGQNQQIFCATDGLEYDEEDASWSRLCNFSQIKYLSTAIASHAS